MNQEFWSKGETRLLYPLARSTRWRNLGWIIRSYDGADYPAWGKLRPWPRLSGKCSGPLLRVASKLNLDIFWGPDFPALLTGRIFRWAKKLRPTSENPEQSPNTVRELRVGDL